MIARRVPTGPQSRVVDGQIAGDTALENIDRAGAEAPEPVQLELHEHGLARLLGCGRQALSDDANRPAPSIVLDAEDALQRLAVDDRVVPAPDDRPVLLVRPLTGEIDLFQLGKVPRRIDLLPDETVAC